MNRNLRCRRLALALSIMFVISVAAACGDDGEPDAGEVLAQFTAAYNAHDLDGVMDTFADDAVIVRHPMDDDRTTTGSDEIRALHAGELPNTASDNAYEFTNIIVDGDHVTFGHRWHTKEGSCFAGDGHRITVADGKIETWEWGTAGLPCV